MYDSGAFSGMAWTLIRISADRENPNTGPAKQRLARLTDDVFEFL